MACGVISLMFRFLHRIYVAVFRQYPVLGRMAVVAVVAEILFASVNNYALSFYVLDDLKQSGRTLGILASTFLGVEMLLKLPFGHLSDRYGRRLFASAGSSCPRRFRRACSRSHSARSRRSACSSG